MSTEYRIRSSGTSATSSYRVYLERKNPLDGEGKLVSFFHDIPAFVNQQEGVVNMVCEIPKWTNAKLEVLFSM